MSYLGAMLIAERDELRLWMAGALAFAVGMGSLVQMGFSIVSDRFAGRLALLASTTISPRSYFLAQAVLPVIQGSIVIALGLALLVFLGQAPAPGAAVVAASVLAGAGAALACGSLGLWIGARAESLIDLTHAVYAESQKPCEVSLDPRCDQCPFQVLLKELSIRQPGSAVVQGERTQLLVG